MTAGPGPALLALVREHEGCKLAPYLCPAGFWTIGYGALWDQAGRRVTPTTPALPSRAAAEELLLRDAGMSISAVRRRTRRPLAPSQVDALADFVFNLGEARLASSTLLRRVNAGDDDDVPAEFARWVYARGLRLPGLVRRRAQEAALWAGAR